MASAYKNTGKCTISKKNIPEISRNHSFYFDKIFFGIDLCRTMLHNS